MSQTFYIHPDNPQKRLLEQVVNILNDGGVIAFPTDSGYSLGCLLDNKQGVDRICQIRQLDKRHHFTLMCSGLSELSCYAYVDNTTFRLLKNNTPGKYVFILQASKEVPRRLLNEKRKTIGLRIPDDKIDLALLELLGQPLMTTTLILPNDDQAQSDPDEIEDKIGHQLDAIVHGGYISQQPTSVIDLTNDYPEIIRKGSGDTKPFE
ncbi:threonylcarbamoyl-AMP synthase [Gilliamella sp. Nev5-1]|uniref:L-threonylcarbamoyladenylate synthase n=1 Tax=unclassified Gilliamella TaxID=2685620 RepID=UPI00080EE633|nr:L-threonylcarbamoyladenylate synthase [Gilliamella apicola]OCG59656.1 threonylcarbamoyl-AMP synthase [Gilliamella apicola]OCG68112.1 threonylcarbamoyl-AMP synthase [Gilliamella apicola]